MPERDDLPPVDHQGDHEPYAYDDGCCCEWCVIERGRWLSRLMFGWMLHV